jgi:signal transduction histidine kinase
MRSERGSGPAATAEAGTTQVLLVTPASNEAPDWPSANGRFFNVTVAPSVGAAVARLAALPYDVVVVDAAAAAVSDGELRQLRDRLGGAGLMILAHEFTDDIPLFMKDLDGAACLLPADAPAGVQAQVVAFAADRARLSAALVQRVAELESRTRELQKSRSHFRDVIERNADAIVVVDGAGVIRFANEVAARLLRKRQEDLAGTEFGFPLTAGETTELDLLHPEGVRVVEMRVVESEWEGEAAYIASLRDTTERRRAEEGARRLIREQAARSAAESAARRFRFQADAGVALSAQVDYAATVSTLASLCADEMADWVVIYSVDERGKVLRIESAHCQPEHVETVRALREIPVPLDSEHPVLEVLRTRAPLLVSHADDETRNTGPRKLAHDERHLEIIRRLGITSYLIVPLIARDRALGAIKLVSSSPDRRFNEDDLAWASDLASRAALALDNARLYQHAQEANHAKSDLLAVISHDLRTPLNAIIGYSDLLSMGIPDTLTDAALAHVDRVAKSAHHLLYLIDELSSFARIEAGSIAVKPQDVDVHALVQEVSTVMEPLAAERGLEFHVDLPPDPPALHTDPDRLRQVLLNLCGNAVKYSEHGAIKLEVAHSGDGGVVFHVRDTGIGISPDNIEKVFEPFWQVNAQERPTNRGTGLGLSIVRRLVSMLGGDVSVESVEGEGSTFTVRLGG